jgi:hypothetical protein
MDTTVDDPATRELLRRVRGEFMEMPGLRLNLPQAQRLWALVARRCEAVLKALVEGGVLACTQRVYSLRRSQP